MKNHRFPWLRNRTTDNRKCEKARNIKEKRTIEMFNTVSKQLVALRSSQRVITKNIKRTSKPLEIQYFQGFSLCLHFRKKIYKYRKPLIPVLAGPNGL